MVLTRYCAALVLLYQLHMGMGVPLTFCTDESARPSLQGTG